MLVASVVVSVPCRTCHVIRVSRARTKVFRARFVRFESESLRELEIFRFFLLRLVVVNY